MQTLFFPAIRLMNRLRYAWKFAVLGLCALAVMAFLLFNVVTASLQNIRTTQNELNGLQLLRHANRAVEFMQQHRGLSSGYLNGNVGMKEKVEAKGAEVDAAVTSLGTALPTALSAFPGWTESVAEWRQIRASGLDWGPPENLRRHTAVIERMLAFMVDIADHSELTLEGDIAPYYMMDTVVSKMPTMLEPLGLTRARGTGALARKEVSPLLRIDLIASMALMEGNLKAQNVNLDKVGRYAPQLQGRLREASKKFSDDTASLFALVRKDILGEEFTTDPDRYFAITTALIDQGYGMIYGVLIPTLEGVLHARADDDRRNMVVGIALFVLAVLVFSYLALGAYYSVVNSVAEFQSGARRMAEGDFRARFAVTTRDELRLVGDDFNRMVDALQHLIGTVQREVHELRSASESLAAQGEKIAQGASVQSDSAAGMAAAVEQMTVGVDSIAGNSRDAQTLSGESATLAEQGAQTMQRVLDDMRGIADTVNTSEQTIAELGEQSQRISAIVDAIKDIADQTNLLALNAAIEAARAGEAGRGFAVVADEVRKLSERTALSTGEIAGMISAVQSGTQAAIEAMKQGVSRVSQGVAQAREAGEAIEGIQQRSHQSSVAISGISDALREQSQVSADLARSVEDVARMAEENNLSVQATIETARRLHQLADTLGREVDRFRT